MRLNFFLLLSLCQIPTLTWGAGKDQADANAQNCDSAIGKRSFRVYLTADFGGSPVYQNIDFEIHENGSLSVTDTEIVERSELLQDGPTFKRSEGDENNLEVQKLSKCDGTKEKCQDVIREAKIIRDTCKLTIRNVSKEKESDAKDSKNRRQESLKFLQCFEKSVGKVIESAETKISGKSSAGERPAKRDVPVSSDLRPVHK